MSCVTFSTGNTLLIIISSVATGRSTTRIRSGIGGRRANAKMKVNKYSDKGITHNRGTEAMSVDIKLVTPSIKLDGTNASNSQRARRVRLNAFESRDKVASREVLILNDPSSLL